MTLEKRKKKREKISHPMYKCDEATIYIYIYIYIKFELPQPAKFCLSREGQDKFKGLSYRKQVGTKSTK